METWNIYANSKTVELFIFQTLRMNKINKSLLKRQRRALSDYENACFFRLLKSSFKPFIFGLFGLKPVHKTTVYTIKTPYLSQLFLKFNRKCAHFGSLITNHYQHS